VGTGRLGRYDEPLPLSAFAERVCDTIDFARVRLVGDDAHPVKTVFIGCGSGGSMIDAALAKGADTVVTGEATFHQLLSARGVGAAVVLTGHYASERFTVEALAVRLGAEFPEIECWASRHETDPVRTLP
jgi:putative NIF3 family GTP cyclohydrolase 1 type 2